MFNGKMKALTFSYDDGVLQDIRLIELFNKYGMKATFNLNSELLGKENFLLREGVRLNHTRVKAEDVKHIYENHEIAAHTLTHKRLGDADDREVIRQVEEDRLNLSELCGYEVVGMAYPVGSGTYDERVVELIRRETGVKYARNTTSAYNFEIQSRLLDFKPSIYHKEMDEMLRLGEEFLSLKSDCPQLFYIWGHSYEFDIDNTWARFEEFLKLMSGRKDIFYCTNRQALLGE